MGRNYILERTIADPKMRAADKAARKLARAKRLRSEKVATAAYVERARWCANGCGKPVATGDDGWIPCCSEACHCQWEAAVSAQFDAQQARHARAQELSLRTADMDPDIYRAREADAQAALDASAGYQLTSHATARGALRAGDLSGANALVGQAGS